MHDYHRLDVWILSRRLVRDIYLATRSFPSQEQFGLTQQMRRAAVSIPSNIAEGSGRGGDKDFARFVRIALGSACELDTQLLIGFDLLYLEHEPYEHLRAALEAIKAKLNGLERSLTTHR